MPDRRSVTPLPPAARRRARWAAPAAPVLSGDAATAGTTASTAQPAAASPIPTRMVRGHSSAACRRRGPRAGQEAHPERLDERRHTEPGGQRNHGDRQRHRDRDEHRRRPAPARPWISPCSSSHSDTNPLPGGSAAAASAPNANSAVVTGIRAASPPSRSRSRSPVDRSTEPAPRNSSALNAGVVDRVQQRGAPSAGPARRAVARRPRTSRRRRRPAGSARRSRSWSTPAAA